MRPFTCIVIGGGVIGLSTAYFLARQSRGRIILLEKGCVGDGSSRRAAGIITDLLWTETGVLARKKSLALYRELSDDLEGYEFADVGCLNLFTPQSWAQRESLLPLYDRLDAPYERLDADEIRRRWPTLNPPDDLIGLLDPRGGYSEPDDYVPALAARCRQHGVAIREHQKVTDFVVRDGRMSAVRVGGQTIEADAVVCTVHSWSNCLLANVGMSLPIKSFVHQRYLTRPLPSPPRIPAVNADPMGGYFRPATGNRLLLGIETADREEFVVENLDFTMSSLGADSGLKDRLMSNFSALLGPLSETTWDDDGRIGLIMSSMDGEPLLGPVTRLPGLFIGTAFHSGGFAYNPVAGLTLAELVMDGRSSVDVSSFSPERFDAAATEEFLDGIVSQNQSQVQRKRH